MAQQSATAQATEVGMLDDLVRRAQDGDVGAFEGLYRTHAGAVLALCRRMVRDDADARELLQDVFVRAWERLTSFKASNAGGESPPPHAVPLRAGATRPRQVIVIPN